MFEGQKWDDVPFNKIFEQLWSDKTLCVPGRKVVVYVPVLSVPKGFDWKLAGKKVIEWFKGVRSALPDGKSEHRIPGLNFDLPVTVHSMDLTKWIPGGVVWVMRILPDDACQGVVRKALDAKVSKLADTRADRRMLLIECATPWSDPEITEAMESVGPEFPKLAEIETIWVVDTTPWLTERCVGCQTIWPNKVRELFLVSCYQDGGVADVE